MSDSAVHCYHQASTSTLFSLCGVNFARNWGRGGKQESRKNITFTVENITCVDCLQIALIKKNDEAARIAKRILEVKNE